MRTFEWNGNRREIGSPGKSDFEIAGEVRMLMRDQLNHERVCTDARDRIMSLSEIVRDLHVYSLVIESAVRRQEGTESGNYRAIRDLLRKAREAQVAAPNVKST